MEWGLVGGVERWWGMKGSRVGGLVSEGSSGSGRGENRWQSHLI